MRDPRDFDESLVVVDAVENPVVTAPKRPYAGELANERLSAAWALAEAAKGCKDRFLLGSRQAPQVPGRAPRNHNPVCRGHSGRTFALELFEVLHPTSVQVGDALT